MACQITVIDLVGIFPNVNQTPDQLEVTGTAQECGKVCVTVQNTLNNTTTIELTGEVDTDGNWSIVFDANNGDFNLGDFTCGSNQKIVVEARCCNDPNCGKTRPFDVLNCRPHPQDCPSVTVEVISVAPDCDTQGQRSVTLRATISGAPDPTIYEWDFGDGQNSSSEVFSNSPVEITHNYDASGPGNSSYIAELRVVFPQGCPSGSVTVDVPPCDVPPCPDRVSLEVVDDAGNIIDTENLQCLPTGNYSVNVAEPSGSNLSFFWTVDGQLQQGATGSQFNVDLIAGSSIEINVAVVQDGCPPLADSVTLTGCQQCPDRAVLEVIDSNGNVINLDDAECLPTGNYTIRVSEPANAGLNYSWSIDGQLQSGVTGNQFDYNLSESETVEISMGVQPPGCPILTDAVVLNACTCPDENIGIEVTDSDGNTVDLNNCAESGAYFMQATGDNLDDANLQWTVNGTPAGNGTQTTVNFNASSTGFCCFSQSAPATSDVKLTASSNDPNCPDREASVILTGCPSAKFCIDCWLLRLAILFFATLAAIGAAIWLCTAAVVNPVVPFTAGWAGIAAVVAPIVAIVALIIAVLILLFWWWCCKPTWCDDWMVLLWQILLSAGFVFVYFGTCPACILTLLPIGVILFGGGVGVFIWWIASCSPTLCKIFFEIGSLGLVQLVVSWLELIIGACVWFWGWLILLIWNTLLNLLGWIGTVIACRVNPNQ